MSKIELVGILNVTPDSFSDGGLYADTTKALERANELFNEGASYLDIGAESTRPGATPISLDEEWDRLYPVIDTLVPTYPGHISIDTYHPETIRRIASTIGDVIINDVTTFNNPKMVETAAELGFRCIVSHLPEAVGTDIQAAHQGEKVDSVAQVRDELLTKKQRMEEAGIAPEMIILDPGIGFGKTPRLNRKLLYFAAEVPGTEVMIGYSRKRFLGSEQHRMNIKINLEAGFIAMQAGAKYLRVHDIAGHTRLLNQ